MFRRFGKMGAPSSLSNSSAPPITKYIKIDCKDAYSTFSPPEDKLYDCENAQNNYTDKIIDGGKS